MWKLCLLFCAIVVTIAHGKVFDVSEKVSNITPITAADTTEWWKNAVIYQIYPRSLLDTNKDGIGDLKGITKKMDHFKELGVDAIWLSPIMQSPMADFGYDISNFREIHGEYGTMKDFDELLAATHNAGLKLLLDFVPNHSSDEHEWFKESEKGTEKYKDFYIWEEGKNKNTEPPNNWVSAFGGKGGAWQYSEKRKLWYLHQFHEKQPDLNYRNKDVREEMKEIMRFWFDKGVDGFRIDAVPYLVEVKELTDEPETGKPGVDSKNPDFLNHIYTQNQPETYDIVYEWRDVVEEEKYKGKTVLLTEAYAPIKETMLYYGNGEKEGAHFTFNFQLLNNLNSKSSAQDYANAIQIWLTYMPVGKLPNWLLGNHDQHRIGTRLGAKNVDGAAMIDLLLPGVGIIYQGEEIGMLNGEVSFEETKDPAGINAGPEKYLERSRDFERTPFHWDDSEYAGFTESGSKKPWLPVADGYKTLNVKKQKAAEESHFKVYQELIKLRKEKVFKEGLLDVRALSGNVIGFTRTLLDGSLYVVLFNVGDNKETVDLANFPMIDVSKKLTIKVKSVGATLKADSIEDGKVTLQAHESYVLEAGNLVKGGAGLHGLSFSGALCVILIAYFNL